jgi:sulfur-oxidizing protein SoxA
MAGVKAVYPKWNEEAGEVRTIEMQVNDCRDRTGWVPSRGSMAGGDMTNMVALIWRPCRAACR